MYSIGQHRRIAASAQSRLKTNDQQQHRQQQAAHGDADTLRRRNRKRCNDDLSPTTELKKFREGGGNHHTHYGTGNTKNNGLAKVSYESELLHLNTNGDESWEQSTIINKGCCWAAGNDNLLNNSDCKHLLSSNEFKSIENNVEYEKILFETHGCSIYHLHRLQLLDNDCTETEF
ncbi:uncharacterized protein LOC143340989 isoform X2 [Colletes latitarsis]|uniref:uncharacterized protein LOC143340989 isoform X2 n=1 Tax=Colletes latitarsis TaxID=2605962 RepID=UPI004035C8D5